MKLSSACPTLLAVLVPCATAEPFQDAETAGGVSLTAALAEGSYFAATSARAERPWGLLDATTGAVVDPAWAGNAELWPVAGTDEWGIQASERALAVLLDERADAGLLTDPFQLRRAFASTREANDPSARRTLPPAILHEDGRRLVLLRDGDLWRGVFDWESGEVVDERRSTELGVFLSPRPLVWSGRFLFLWGGFDAEKPVVRIDLEAGGAEELAWLNFTPLGDGPGRQPVFTVSPDEEVAIGYVGDWIQLVDLADGHTLRVPLELAEGEEDAAVADPGLASAFASAQQTHWADARHAYVFGYAGRARLDLDRAVAEARSWRRVVGEDVDFTGQASFEYRVPHTDVCVLRSGRNDGAPMYLAFDLGTESVTVLPDDVSASMARLGGRARYQWLDGTRFVHGVGDGGLDRVGLWMHDLSSGESKRLATFPDFDGLALVRRANRLVVERTTQGSAGRSLQVLSIDLASGETVPVADGWHRVRPLPERRVALGFGAGAAPEWGEMRERVLPDVRGSRAPLGGLAGLLERVEDRPDDLRTFAVQAYQYIAPRTGGLYDPQRAALAMVEHVEAERAERVAAAKERSTAGYPEITPDTNPREASKIRHEMETDAAALEGRFDAPRIDQVTLRTDFSVAVDEEAARRLARRDARNLLDRGLGRGLSEAQQETVLAEVEAETLKHVRASSQLLQATRLIGVIRGFVQTAIGNARRGG